jgi:uncharacterized ParB-like nuclease family protein
MTGLLQLPKEENVAGERANNVLGKASAIDAHDDKSIWQEEVGLLVGAHVLEPSSCQLFQALLASLRKAYTSTSSHIPRVSHQEACTLAHRVLRASHSISGPSIDSCKTMGLKSVGVVGEMYCRCLRKRAESSSLGSVFSAQVEVSGRRDAYAIHACTYAYIYTHNSHNSTSAKRVRAGPATQKSCSLFAMCTVTHTLRGPVPR